MAHFGVLTPDLPPAQLVIFEFTLIDEVTNLILNILVIHIPERLSCIFRALEVAAELAKVDALTLILSLGILFNILFLLCRCQPGGVDQVTAIFKQPPRQGMVNP